jgi:hypothetical protein
MRNLDLNAYGVREMTQREILSIDGGSIFSAIGDWFSDAAEWVEEAVEDACEWIGEAAKAVWEGMKKYGNTDGNPGVHAPM